MADYYSTWIEEQSKSIETAMRGLGRKGVFTAAVYVIPSNRNIPGKLVTATEKPEGATDVVRFPAQGSNIMAVPYGHLRSLLWTACRSLSISVE
jgi:hypothetical protein